MNLQRVIWTTAVAGCLVMPGCAGNQGGTGQSSASGSSAAASSRNRVPGDARAVSASRSRIIHRTLRDGTIWVQDLKSGDVVHTGRAGAGDNIVVDPRANVIAVNDQQVRTDLRLNPGNTYRLYFMPQR